MLIQSKTVAAFMSRYAQWIVALGCLGICTLFFYTLEAIDSNQAQLEQRYDSYVDGLKNLQEDQVFQKTILIPIAAQYDGTRHKTLVITSPTLIKSYVAVTNGNEPHILVIEGEDKFNLRFVSDPRLYSVIIPPHAEGELQINTLSSSAALPAVEFVDTTEFQTSQWIRQILLTLIILFPVSLLSIMWFLGGLGEGSLRVWVTISILLSLAIVATFFQYTEIHSSAMESRKLSGILVFLIGLKSITFCAISRTISMNSHIRRQMDYYLVASVIAASVASLEFLNDPAVALIGIIGMTMLISLGSVLSLQAEAFFSIWARGAQILAIFKLIAGSVSLYLFFTPHSPKMEVTVALMFGGSSPVVLLLTQLISKRSKDRLTKRFTVRQQTQASIKHSEAGVRLRETLRGYRHDIRQPLQSLTLMLGLELHLTQGDKRAERTQKMMNAQKSLSAMLDDMFVTMENTLDGKARSTNDIAIDSVLGPLVNEYRQIASNKELYVRYVPTRIKCAIDPEPLKRLIRNIIDNAVKYTQTGGLLVGVRWSNNSWNIIIQDSGPGISSQAKACHKGWGYGTVQIHKLARRLNGKLHITELRNKSGHIAGTRVALQLPRQRPNLENDAQRDLHESRLVVVCGGTSPSTAQLLSKLVACKVDVIHVNNVRSMIHNIGHDSLPAGLICVVDSSWTPHLDEWQQQFDASTGIQIPTLWIDNRSECEQIQDPVPQEGLDVAIEKLSDTTLGYLLADQFGITAYTPPAPQEDFSVPVWPSVHAQQAPQAEVIS